MALLVLRIVAHGQPPASLTPPTQTWIYNLNGYAYVPVASAPVLNLGTSFSIEFWMLLNRDVLDGQYMRVFSKAGDYELDVEPGTHQLTYSLSTHFGRIGVSLQPGLWYHVAMVSDNLQVTLYLNGQQKDQFTASGPPPVNSSPLVLAGQAYGDGTQYCCGFPGMLRQFRIWSRALQATEITSFATKLLSGNEPGLIADWPFDDGTGDTFHDIGPNHLPLRLVGDPVGRSTAWIGGRAPRRAFRHKDPQS